MITPTKEFIIVIDFNCIPAVCLLCIIIFLNLQMTKKLNFHINNKIYKNLIELNASIEDTKIRKDKRSTTSAGSTKRDLEPDIEDFCNDEREIDSPPKITIVKPKFKPIREVEDGHLHKLVASFEVL